MQRQREKAVPTAVEKLVTAMRSAITNSCWEILTEALYGREENKAAAWKQLSPQEQQQLTQLTPPDVKLLAQARKAGKIAAFAEHSTGGIYSVWRTFDDEAETLSSTALSGFLQNLA
jgi:hypothetical protein